MILENKEIKIVLSFMMKCCQEKGRKQRKDRKTSFFRTILKHLKQVLCKKLKRSSDGNGDIIYQLQEKLSNNTICNDDIN